MGVPLQAQPNDPPPDARGIRVMDSAWAQLQPQRGAAQQRSLKLSHRWDDEFPGQGGTATYRITLPPRQGDEDMALLFSRVGNQAQVAINGQVRLKLGQLGNPRRDAAKTVHLLEVPARWLSAAGPNELVVQVTTQAARWGGLSTVQYGPAAAVSAEFATQRQWRYVAPLVFCVAFGLMGLMALALWSRLRDPIFACFAAAALLGIFRNLDRVWPEVPVPWPAWGMVTATAYAWHLALMCLFALQALGLQGRRTSRVILAYLPVSLVLVVLAFSVPWPAAWTLALAALAPVGALTWGLVLRTAWRPGDGHRVTACLLALAGGAAILAGLHDLGLVRLGLGGPSRFSLTPHAMFLFVVIMAGIIVDRYARSARNLQALNHTLEARIDARERELHQAFGELEARRAAQVTANERQRILRDLHDGVGAQLVGLLNLVKQPGTRPALLEEQVKAALDEMRLAVDSMQISDGDLTTALATLRYRAQPRLQAAGLTLHWDVQELPVLAGMGPRTVLQVQRIVLEALTNVLKHAHASAVWVHCAPAVDAAGWLLTVADDGCGLPEGSRVEPGSESAADGGPTSLRRAGEGMASMRARAHSIGASLQWAPRVGGGTVVQLGWSGLPDGKRPSPA
ncbi:MAG: sensor histidine kinase [Ramlibacter sp.]